ncbi:MAG: hypothetical protein IT165_08090 [Bryobacterales bacterium]|nr:hypothetical protein [Bryobacterales bacterium]
MTPSRLLLTFFISALWLSAQDRPGLFFREDWKETPAATPITQAHVANPDLILSLHGPGKAGVKKSHHDKPADDPYYVWSGTAEANWAVSLRHASRDVDLRGLAKIRWRSKQAGFRYLRPVLRLADGAWLVGDAADGPSSDWREREFPIADIHWRRLDIATVVEGKWVEHPDLSRVTEIGFTDLMRGGESDACSRLDWMEVYGRGVARKP